MRRKLKQKRRNFEITEILKRCNFEADAERENANRVISVLETYVIPFHELFYKKIFCCKFKLN